MQHGLSNVQTDYSSCYRLVRHSPSQMGTKALLKRSMGKWLMLGWGRRKVGSHERQTPEHAWKSAFRFSTMCWGVIVAATFFGEEETNSTASLVVICSITIRKCGSVFRRGFNFCSMNTFSLSNMSTWPSVTSPCTRSNKPTCLEISCHTSIEIYLKPCAL